MSKMNKMNVAELRQALSERGLESTGVKAVLFQRLQDASNKDVTNSSSPSAKSNQKVKNNTTPTDTKMDTKTTTKIDSNISKETVSLEDDILSAFEIPSCPIEKSSTLSFSPVSTSNNISADTLHEKKSARAKRFGIPLVVSEKEKKALRVGRFGIDSYKNIKGKGGFIFKSSISKLSSEENEKRSARAKRFGLPM